MKLKTEKVDPLPLLDIKRKITINKKITNFKYIAFPNLDFIRKKHRDKENDKTRSDNVLDKFSGLRMYETAALRSVNIFFLKACINIDITNNCHYFWGAVGF